MRIRLVIGSLVAFVVVAGLIFVGATDHDQPGYEGKSVTAWFKLYWSPSKPPGEDGRTLRAWKAMGTNAIPFLLTQYYTRPDPQWRTNLHAVLMRLPKAIRPNPCVPA